MEIRDRRARPRPSPGLLRRLTEREAAGNGLKPENPPAPVPPDQVEVHQAWSELPLPVREVAEFLTGPISRPLEPVDPELRRAVSELVGRREPDAIWSALRVVHGRLDREGAEGDLPWARVSERRERLNRLTVLLAEETAAEAVRAHRELLRDVSHDIRSPLNSILFLTEGLVSHRTEGMSATQKRQLGIIYAAGASLLNLVNDLLDFARTSESSGGDVAAIPFGLGGVVADVRRLVAPLTDHHGVEVDFEVNAYGPRLGDPQILCRLLVNLITNAIEAVDLQGRVYCRFDEYREEDGEEGLVLTVEDEGVGAEIHRIRELVGPHRELRVTQMLRGRTHGLGLVICGRMVRSAGGDLEVEEGGKGGVRFTIRLPFGRLEEE